MQNIFTWANPYFYETLSYHPISPENTDRLKDLLPDGWTLQRDDMWVHARSPDKGLRAIPVVQGFKIHVSSTPIHAQRVLDIIVPVCAEYRADFKIAGDPTLLHILNSKLYARGYSGKFMTIYPSDEDIFRELIERLYKETKEQAIEGAYILSDRRYKDSKVLFYRYGGFHSPRRVNIDGTHSMCLVSPTGEYVSDERLPYFHLPHWVRDPFGRAQNVPNQVSVLLNDRYRIEGAVAFSNSGGIYYGIDTTTGKSIIVKEARPLTNCWSVGERVLDATYLLKHEYEMLLRLADLDFVPKPIELFEDWEHTFLVEERISGINLYQYWARDEVILAPYIRRTGRIERWIPKFKRVAETLIGMVTALHNRGVLFGDMSPRNIMINTETHQMWFIDFESAVQADDGAEVLNYATRWGTPGFLHPARASRNRLMPEDDLYAAGMILYSCVLPVNTLFKLNPRSESIFIDKYIALGIPKEVKCIICSLLQGDLEEAQGILTRWRLGADMRGHSEPSESTPKLNAKPS